MQQQQQQQHAQQAAASAGALSGSTATGSQLNGARAAATNGLAIADDPDAPALALYKDSSCADEVPGSTPNHLAWQPPAVLQLGSALLPVVLNPPIVHTLELHNRPMVGHPVMATVEVHFASEGDCCWEWHRLPAQSAPQACDVAASNNGTAGSIIQAMGPSWPPPAQAATSAAANGDGASAPEGVLVCRSRAYTPTAADAGCQLRITCKPGALDSLTEAVSVTSGALCVHCLI